MRPDASTCICATPPTDEPVTLSEVKAHLRVDGADEDTLITMCFTAARERLEQETRRAFLKQQWTAYIQGEIGGCLPVELPRPRLMTAETILLEYRNTDGTWIEFTDYLTQASREPALLWINGSPVDIDSPRSPQDAVWRITYWGGYGETAADVPGSIKHAIMLLTSHLFERREMVISGNIIAEVPKSLDWLIDPYRVPWGGVLR